MTLTAEDILCFRCERCADIFPKYSSRKHRRNDTAEPVVLCEEPNGDDVVCHFKVKCPFWKEKEV